MNDDNTDRIRQLNDALRTQQFGGKIMMAYGVASLPPDVLGRVIASVRTYDWSTADEGNDPYGEHDFGAIDDPDAGKIFWKIDYYDANLEYGSEDPSDPEQTTRVLTIMLASEY